MADRPDGVSGPYVARDVDGRGFELHCEQRRDLVTHDGDSFVERRGFDFTANKFRF